MNQSRRSAEPPGVSRYAPYVGLIALLFGEFLFLTVNFEAERIRTMPTMWGQAVGFAPHVLRLAITVAMVTLLAGGRRWLAAIRNPQALTGRRPRASFVIVHGCTMVLFVWLSGIVLGDDIASLSHPVAWVAAWLLTGFATIVAWTLALFPAQAWLSAARRHRRILCVGFVAGTAIRAGGVFTENLWTSLAGLTFSVVAWLLRLIYAETVIDAKRFVLGTPAFKVAIAPECSGYEGVGLILAFLTFYLWTFRKDLRFPGALALLPMGAAVIWILNALRILALIVIGASGWPAIARGGFHSQVGWLTFNSVALGFVALTMRGRYFAKAAEPRDPTGEPTEREQDATAAFLSPFLAITATAMVTGAFSAGFDWLYPVRIAITGAVLWAFRKNYAHLEWRLSWWPIAVGCVTFVIWLALMPAGLNGKDAWPIALRSIPVHWAAAWLLVRLVGYVVTVPLVEELAFRGFLTRRIVQTDFEKLPVGTFTWSSFLISSALFGALHGGLWLAGTLAGMAFALALYRRQTFGDAVQAHATTNGLIAVYVFATGQWSVWS